jgi:hypothetical protein
MKQGSYKQMHLLVASFNRRPQSGPDVDAMMEEANELIGGYGVEAIKSEEFWESWWWQDTIALYVNMGESYAPTILYDVTERNFKVTSHADWTEEWELDNDD